MNSAAASYWQQHHISDLWGAKDTFSHPPPGDSTMVCGFLWFSADRSLLWLVSPPAVELSPDHLHDCESSSALLLHPSPPLPGKGPRSYQAVKNRPDTSELERLAPVWSAGLKTSPAFISYTHPSRLQIEARTRHKVTPIQLLVLNTWPPARAFSWNSYRFLCGPSCKYRSSIQTVSKASEGEN